MNSINAAKRRDLLNSPQRGSWDSTSYYSSVLLVPSGKKHDSGYHLIALVGMVIQDEKYILELVGYCDDVEWQVSPNVELLWGKNHLSNIVQMDCSFPAGVIRVWSYKNHFQVGACLSSTTVTVLPGELK